MIDLLIKIFTYLPEILVHAILAAGIFGFVLTALLKIVYVAIPQRLLLHYLSIFLIVLGLYLEGGLAVTKEFNERLTQWNAKVQIAESKSKEVQQKVRIIYKDKIVKVKEQQVVYRDRLAAAEGLDCKVTPEAISILNDAAGAIK